MRRARFERLKYLIISVLLLLGAAYLHAQTYEPVSLEYKKHESTIRFRIDKSVIDFTYGNNTQSTADIRSFIDSVGVSRISDITIYSYASPDGRYSSNKVLAGKRSQAVISMLCEKYPEIADKVTIAEEDESWREMRELILSDSNITASQKDELLTIVDSDEDLDQKESRLKKTTSYPYIRSNILTEIRYTDIIFDYFQLIPIPPVEPEPETQAETDTGAVGTYPPMDKATSRKEIFYFRTNLLVPLTNYGVEVCIGDNWSVEADWYFPWVFRNKSHKDCFQILAGNLEGRYWFGRNRSEEDRLEGHAIGLNLAAGYYDFERNFTGIQGEFTNIGINYIYSVPIWNDKAHIEFTAGLGYIYSNVKPYDVFEPGGLAFKRGYTEKFNWFGPTKAGVTLIVPITAKRREGR